MRRREALQALAALGLLAARRQERDGFLVRGGRVVNADAQLDADVRVRDGKRLVTDGPFAETKEQLGGYYLIEAKDVQEAIDIARRQPGVRSGWGAIEIRPVMEITGLPAG